MAYTIYNADDVGIAGDRELEPLKGMCDLVEGGYILEDETLEKVYPVDIEE